MSTMRVIARAINTHLRSKSRYSNSFLSIRTFSLAPSRNMKYVQFTYNDAPDEVRVGYLEEDNVVDINKADTTMPCTMLEILRNGIVDKVRESRQCNLCNTIPLSSVTLVAPIYGVDKILCVGLNYADHCAEQNIQKPAVPMIFSKFSSTIIGQNEPLRIRTEICKKVDWEVELTIVMGKRASNVKAADAYNYVFGYTIAQDITARDWQKEQNGGQFLLGKSQDTFCPIGPCITTSDEIGDPQKLDIKCILNGVEKQSSNTCNLIHSIPAIIERLSSVMTLLPGDLILTGTPGGVGVHRNPPEFLKPGDVILSEIQNIGAFEIKVEQF